MNKTSVKETARQAGPHRPPMHPFDPISSSFPNPGVNTCASMSAFTAEGTYDNSITSIDKVDLVVSVAASGGSPATTRLIHGGTVQYNSGPPKTWQSTFNQADFPQSGDFGMPAVLIVEGTTTVGATFTLYVPFSCNLPSSRPR
jgi:hypothetical protein